MWGCGQDSRPPLVINSQKEAMHGGFLQIRSLTPSPAVKPQKQQGHHGEGRGGLSLRLGGVGRVWPRAPASTLPLGACGSGDSDSGLPSLGFPGCYPCCPSMQRADENSEPKVSPSPPLHAWLPCRSCPRADRIPFRPGCPSTDTVQEDEAALL